MKRYNLFPLMALLCLLAFSCSTEQIDEQAHNAASEVAAPQAKQIEIEILELINNYRLSEGQNALQEMNIIKSQAYSHTDYMIAQSNVSHDNFSERSSFLINNAGALNVSENVAYGYSSAESVVNAWINSPGHRDVMLGNFTNFDISAEMDNQGKWYYTNIFIKK